MFDPRHRTEENDSGYWPTPSATPRGPHTGAKSGSVDAKGRTSAKGVRYGATLETAVKMWPTPVARDWKGVSTRNFQLPNAVKMWPTPRAAIGMTMKLSQGLADLRHKRYLETEVAYQEKAPGGQLNPTWVEWLMGWPLGWTDLKPLAMDKYRNALRLPGKS